MRKAHAHQLTADCREKLVESKAVTSCLGLVTLFLGHYETTFVA